MNKYEFSYEHTAPGQFDPVAASIAFEADDPAHAVDQLLDHCATANECVLSVDLPGAGERPAGPTFEHANGDLELAPGGQQRLHVHAGNLTVVIVRSHEGVIVDVNERGTGENLSSTGVEYADVEGSEDAAPDNAPLGGEERYGALAVSTAHLSRGDVRILNRREQAMVWNREYGWALKLYEPMSGDDCPFEAQIRVFSDDVQRLLRSAAADGVRLVEFDGDADRLDGYDTYDAYWARPEGYPAMLDAAVAEAADAISRKNVLGEEGVAELEGILWQHVGGVFDTVTSGDLDPGATFDLERELVAFAASDRGDVAVEALRAAIRNVTLEWIASNDCPDDLGAFAREQLGWAHA